MSYQRCEARTCSVCDFCELLKPLKEAGMGPEMAITTVLFCIGQVYDIEVEAGPIVEVTKPAEVVH